MDGEVVCSQPDKDYSWNCGTKLVKDPVHGLMQIPGEAWRFIDTPQCQRLMDVKQLGCTQLVYPSACHSRKEHSLGVLYLSDQLVTHVWDHQRDELDMEPLDVVAVRLGGLCHDWGHGPFSHVFDNEFLPVVRPGCDWSHEQMSADMLDYAIDANHIDLSNCRFSNPKEIDMDAAIKLAKEVILAAKDGHVVNRASREKAFLLDMVANPKSGCDVDKWDYVQRDGYHCGIKISFDHELLLKNCKVQENELCFRVNAMSACYDLFHTRAKLFNDVYTHRTGKACEFMIRDVLIAADPYLKIAAATEDPAEFTLLDDTILKEIEKSKVPELAAARALIKRLRRRDLYQFVNQYIVPGATDDEVAKYPKVTSADISAYLPYDGLGPRLSTDDIIVENLVVHHGMKAQNPVENIKFFDPHREDTFQGRVSSQEYSRMLPRSFMEKRVRVYCKRSDAESVSRVLSAFERYQKEQFGQLLQSGCTPVKALLPAAHAPQRTSMGSGNGGGSNKRARMLPFQETILESPPGNPSMPL